MVKYVRFLGVMICALALFVSCDDKKAGNQDGKDIRLSGYVQDEYGMPIPGVSVNLADKVIHTDSEGYFSLSNPVVSGNRYVIKFEKEDYFDFIYSKEVDDTTGALIVMSRFGNSDYTRQVRFSALDGVTVNVRGMIVDIPGEGLVREDGTLYEGEVLMNVLYLNPEEKNFRQMMPGGDLLAIRDNQDTTSLVSYGMVNVIMKDDKGGKLQLREEYPAELSYPIPSSLLSMAEDTLPLWFFDEAKGMWVEEGYALKKGGRYEGVVKHFSWWNGDQATISARVYFSLTDADGNPVPYAQIGVYHSFVEYFILDIDGKSVGYVPANNSVKFRVGSSLVGSLPPMLAREEVRCDCKLDYVVGPKRILVVDSEGNPKPQFAMQIGSDDGCKYVKVGERTDDNGIMEISCVMKDIQYWLSLGEVDQPGSVYSFTYDDFDKDGLMKVVVPSQYVHLSGIIRGDHQAYKFMASAGNKGDRPLVTHSFYIARNGSYDVYLVPDYKYVITCGNVLVGEVDLSKIGSDTAMTKDFDFSMVQVIDSKGSNSGPYSIMLGIHSDKDYYVCQPSEYSSRPTSKDLVSLEAVIEYTDGQIIKPFKKKGDYYLPLTVDVSKDMSSVGSLTLYPSGGTPVSKNLDLCKDASISMGLAKILFRNAHMEIPSYSQKDKRHHASVRLEDYDFNDCKLRIKSRGENSVDMVVRGKGKSCKDSQTARVEGRFKVPALYMGPCHKWSDLCLSKAIPAMVTPIDVAYQFCKSGISFTQLCYQKAGKAELDQLIASLEKNGYAKSVSTGKAEGVMEYGFIKEVAGTEIQVKVKYQEEGTIPRHEMSSQFSYSIGGEELVADAGIVPDESCKCNMLVTISYLSKESRQRLNWNVLTQY